MFCEIYGFLRDTRGAVVLFMFFVVVLIEQEKRIQKETIPAFHFSRTYTYWTKKDRQHNGQAVLMQQNFNFYVENE